MKYQIQNLNNKQNSNITPNNIFFLNDNVDNLPSPIISSYFSMNEELNSLENFILSKNI